MNIWDILIVAALAAVVFFVVRKLLRDKKRGKGSCSCGCCDGCAGCGKIKEE